MAVKTLAEVTVLDQTDADALVCWYKWSTSTTPPAAPTTTQTSQSVSGWSMAEPTISSATDAAGYVYAVWQLRWKDGSCDWSDVTRSSSFEAAKVAYNEAASAKNMVNNLEIGGRNLLLGRTLDDTATINGLTFNYDASTGFIHVYGTNTKTDANWSLTTYNGMSRVTQPLTPGQEYTLSVSGDDSFLDSGLYVQANAYNTSGNQYGQFSVGKDHGNRTVHTAECASNYAVHDLYLNAFIGVYATTRAVDSTFRLKLEKGNKATDWSPAPEDIESDLATETAQRKAQYGDCTTAAATAAKVVSISNFSLYTGATISVRFVYGNTAASPSLNVNSTGGKAVVVNGSATPSADLVKWGAYATCRFTYDGTYWRFVGSDNDVVRISSAETSITNNAEAILLRATKTEAAALSSTNDNLIAYNPDPMTRLPLVYTGRAATYYPLTAHDGTETAGSKGHSYVQNNDGSYLMFCPYTANHFSPGDVIRFEGTVYAASSVNLRMQLWTYKTSYDNSVGAFSENYVGLPSGVWTDVKLEVSVPANIDFSSSIWYLVGFSVNTATTLRMTADSRAYRVSKSLLSAEASISVNAGNIESKVSKNGVISSINQSSESVKIQASKVEIDGTTVFKVANAIPDTRNDNQPPSWYFTNYPKQSVTEFKLCNVMGLSGEVYCYVTTVTTWADSSGGYPKQTAQVGSKQYWRVGASASAWGAWQESETTSGAQDKVNALEIGGRNLFVDTDRYLATLNGTAFGGENSLDNVIPAGETITVSVEINADNLVWASSGNRRIGCETSVAKTGGGTQFIGAWAGYALSDASNIVEVLDGSMHKRISKTFTLLGDMVVGRDMTLYMQNVQSGTVSVGRVKVEKGDKATDWTPATEDALGVTQRIYYRSTSSSKPSAPTVWVSEAQNNANAYSQWTTKVPPLAASTASGQTQYPYLWTCEQRKSVGGQFLGCTAVQLDDTTTVIDGGNIITGSVKANKLDAANINAAHLLTVGSFSSDTQDSVLNSNVKVGSVNLLQKTGTKFPKTGTSSGYFVEYNVNNGLLGNAVTLVAGETYTFSVDVTSSVGPFQVTVGAGSGTYSYDVAGLGMTFTSGRISITFTPTAAQLSTGSTFAFRAPRYGTSGTSFTYTVSKPKLEKGNTATDWTLAPEDVDAGIASAAQTATNYITQIDSAGIFVSPANQTPTTSSPGNSTRITSDGLMVYRNNTSVAFFGGSARIGKSNADRVTVDSTDGITIYKGNSRRIQTTANGMDVYGSDGTTKVAQFGSTTRVGPTSGPHIYIDTSAVSIMNSSSSTAANIGAIEYDDDDNNARQTSYIDLDAADSSTVMHLAVDSASPTPNDAYAEITVRPPDDWSSAQLDMFTDLGTRSTGINQIIEKSGDALLELTAQAGDYVAGLTVSYDTGTGWNGIQMGDPYFGNEASTSDIYLGAPNRDSRIVSNSKSTNTSMSNGSGTALTSVQVTGGTWLIEGHATFASNNTGRRILCVNTTSGTIATSTDSAATVSQTATNGAATYMAITTIYTRTTKGTTTLYLNGQQNSGSSLNCTGAWIRAVRLI